MKDHLQLTSLTLFAMDSTPSKQNKRVSATTDYLDFVEDTVDICGLVRGSSCCLLSPRLSVDARDLQICSRLLMFILLKTTVQHDLLVPYSQLLHASPSCNTYCHLQSCIYLTYYKTIYSSRLLPWSHLAFKMKPHYRWLSSYSDLWPAFVTFANHYALCL